MKIAAVSVAILALAVLAWDSYGEGANPCPTGAVRGFAYIRGDQRLGGVGAIPSDRFSNTQSYFWSRYNCTRKGVLVKRLDTGVYDVLFPDNPAATVSASAVNGIVTSVVKLDRGYFRISIRSPLIDNGILQYRESPFFIVIF